LVKAARFVRAAPAVGAKRRALRRVFGKCVSWGCIPRVPKAKLKREMRREKLLDDMAEAKLMPFLRQPLKDIIVIMRDTGMRNISEVCRMRIEHIDWHNRVIFNPKGKTPEARRSVPMSDRVLDLLMTRCAGKTDWMGVSFGSVESWTPDSDQSAICQGQGEGRTSQRLGDVLCAA